MRVFYITLFLILIAGLASGIQVVDVIDGDTFRLADGQKVRLIGVDCPESKDPNKPVEYFSAEYGDERTDKYGRLLCYVWVDDTLLVNLEIVKQGYGMAYLRFPHKLERQFLDAELTARHAAIGMWASPRSREIIQDVNPKSSSEWEEYQQMLKQDSLKAVTVYITKSGSKYHRTGCRYLSKSMIPISLKDAKERGYTPCKVCKPPR